MLAKKAPVKLPQTNLYVLDFEGLSLDCRWNSDKPLYMMVGLCVDSFGEETIEKYYNIDKALERVKSLHELGYYIIAHNAKFDLACLESRGVHLTHSVMCTMVMSYIRDTSAASQSLSALTGEKDDLIGILKEANIIPADIGKSDFWNIDWSKDSAVLSEMMDYCVNDVKACYGLYKRLSAWYNLDDSAKFRTALWELEFPMLHVLAHMETHGFNVNERKLQALHSTIEAEKETYANIINSNYSLMPQLTWDGDNDCYVAKEVTYKKSYYKNSSLNLAHHLDKEGVCKSSDPTIVYNRCELIPYNANHATGHNYWLLSRECPEALDVCESTKTGKPRLNKEFFADIAEQLPDNLPIAALLKSTKDLQITTSIAEHIHDGRIHCSYNNCLTRTGRLSSSKPNLANIPRADKEPGSVASQFRQMFTASSDDKIILVADLDRIEICVLAWYLLVAMKDSSLADVCNTPGSDVHQSNADKWGLSRIVAKTLIFLLIYGGGANLIFRRRMAASMEEAESMVCAVDKEQPSINKLKASVWHKARERGFITNPFNCRGIYKELFSKKKWEVGRAERQSFNFLIQRTARDIMHYLSIKTLEVVSKYEGACITNQVYDELVIECYKADAEAIKLELAPIWNNRKDILPGVIINGDWNTGDSWYSAKG